MKTNLIGLATAAVTMTAFSALAQAPCHTHEARPNYGAHDSSNEGAYGEDDNYGDTDNYRDTDNVNYDTQASGRYELRTTQQWVADRYEQVPVEQCRVVYFGGGNHHRFHFQGGRTICSTGYESRLIPGHYENVQQQVWVPVFRPPTARVEFSHRAPAFGRVGFSIGFH